METEKKTTETRTLVEVQPGHWRFQDHIDEDNKKEGLPNANQDLSDKKQELSDPDNTNEVDLPDKANVFTDESTKLTDEEQVENMDIDTTTSPGEMTTLPEDKEESQMVTTEINEMTTLPEDKEDSQIVTACIKYVCNSTEDHVWNLLVEKDKPSWCTPTGVYGGVRCQGNDCGKVFVNKVDDPGRQFKPSIKKPIHVCANHRLYCTFGYCHSCFNKEMAKGYDLLAETLYIR